MRIVQNEVEASSASVSDKRCPMGKNRIASEKIQDPQKALNDLQKRVDDLMAKTLKSFLSSLKSKSPRKNTA